ncbi:hypothetical protein FHR94_003839 [Halomonas cerina]|uniref:Uncharacterized protein n=1 Tax=Halomonas cerina TaxID=447424 RepID=A0A839VAM6_9GAMM|nr:hypothetical protein [Halomonas cerina]
MQLTIQIHLGGEWQDAARLELPDPERGTQGPARLGYLQDYALEWMFRDDEHACSLTMRLWWGASSRISNAMPAVSPRPA